MDSSSDYLLKKLSQKNLRFSFQRMKILEYLYQHESSHLDAEEIYEALSRVIPGLSKTTIYNTLHTFQKAELIQAVDIENSETRYELSASRHGHFICKQCGGIHDFEVDMDAIVVKELSQFQIEEKDVYFRGLCPDCLRTQKESTCSKKNKKKEAKDES